MKPSRRMPLALWAMLPLVASVAIQAAYTLLSQRSAMDSGLENQARSLSRLVIDVVGPSIAFDDDKAVAEGLGYLSNDPDFAFAAAIAPDGHTIAFRGAGFDASSLGFSLHNVGTPQLDQRPSLLVAGAPVVTDHHQIGTIFVGLSTRRAHDHATQLATWATAISVLGILIAVIVVRVLARKIARQNQQMRLVLDHIDEALATVRPDGSLSPECSAAFRRWFGEPNRSHFAAQLAPDDDRLRAMLELSWSEIVEGVMPIEVLVDQFPRRLERDGKHFRIDIKPLFEDEVLTGALLRVCDVTDEVETHRSLAAQLEYVSVFERSLADPAGVQEFITDTGRLVANLGTGLDEQRRALHTIKGNAAVFGVDSVARAAHRLEDAIDEGGRVDETSLRELDTAWSAFILRVDRLVGAGVDRISVPRAELAKLAELSEHGDGSSAAAQLRGLMLEPVALRLDGFRSQAARIAERVDKPAPEVIVVTDDVRLAPDRLRGFWAAFPHVIRNAIDHGIESVEERRAAGKPDAGRLELRARATDSGITIEIADDGRGVQWDRVRDRARATGVAAESHGDLVAALFSAGLSTAHTVSEVSGRGIGLAAVNVATRAAGGQIDVDSVAGRGTRFVFNFVDSRPRVRPGVRGGPAMENDECPRLIESH